MSVDLMDHLRQVISPGCMPLASELQDCTFFIDSQREGMRRSLWDPLFIKMLRSNGTAIQAPVSAEDFVCHILDCDNGTSVRRLSNQRSSIPSKGFVS